MAVPQEVEDAADPRLHDYVGLTDMALRQRREPAEGLFIGEGEKVIRRALAAGHPLRSLLLARKWLDGLADVVAGHRGARLRRLRRGAGAGHRIRGAPRRPRLPGSPAAAGGRRRAGRAPAGWRCSRTSPTTPTPAPSSGPPPPSAWTRCC